MVLVTVFVLSSFQLSNTLVEKKLRRGPEVCCCNCLDIILLIAVINPYFIMFINFIVICDSLLLFFIKRSMQEMFTYHVGKV